jgi:hypothetical protein
MKKYLLTVFGNFTSEKCNEIAQLMEPLIDSENLKFYFRSGSIIFYFGSNFQLIDVHDFLDMISDELFDTFILVEHNETVTVFMTDEMKEHLFNLEEESGEMVIDLVPNNKSQSIYDEDEDEDDISTILMNQIKNNLKNIQAPSLDELLDKVSEQGIESLTEFELKTLNNYSQK